MQIFTFDEKKHLQFTDSDFFPSQLSQTLTLQYPLTRIYAHKSHFRPIPQMFRLQFTGSDFFPSQLSQTSTSQYQHNFRTIEATPTNHQSPSPAHAMAAAMANKSLPKLTRASPLKQRCQWCDYILRLCRFVTPCCCMLIQPQFGYKGTL
jgi:hypothetical protein